MWAGARVPASAAVPDTKEEEDEVGLGSTWTGGRHVLATVTEISCSFGILTSSTPLERGVWKVLAGLGEPACAVEGVRQSGMRGDDRTGSFDRLMRSALHGDGGRPRRATRRFDGA
ncbi:unnamed protein product [Gadus morhua 'NCC']